MDLSDAVTPLLIALFTLVTVGIRTISKRLERVQAEQRPNGGSSMRDSIEAIRKEVSSIGTKIEEIDAQVRGRLELENGGYFMTDANGSCLWTSSVWSQLTGVSVEDARGDGWVRGILEEDREEVWSAWSMAVRTKTHFDKRYRTAKGTLVHGRAVELYDTNKRLVGALGVISPVTLADAPLSATSNLADCPLASREMR